MKKNFKNTSWQKVAPWYNRITEHGQGHYYHQHIIIPGVLRLLDLNLKVLDIACGNGVLAKSLPKNIEYMGVDIAPSLIKEAQRTDHNPKHKYLIADVTKPLSISEQFDAATIILALQNISNPQNVLNNVSKLLNKNCKLIIVLNHPAFRIPHYFLSFSSLCLRQNAEGRRICN